MTCTKLANYEFTLHLGSMGMGNVYSTSLRSMTVLMIVKQAGMLINSTATDPQK
jgi:hypothetical protein